jgi:hypothetical protein
MSTKALPEFQKYLQSRKIVSLKHIHQKGFEGDREITAPPEAVCNDELNELDSRLHGNDRTKGKK